MPTPPMCGVHSAAVYEQGGTVLVGTLDALFDVGWQRVRDDISKAHVSVSANDCCDVLALVGTVKHELHVYRNGVPVWEGVITRLDYEWDRVDIHAEDILWVMKRRALEVGYNYLYPPAGPGAVNAIDHCSWLLENQGYLKYNDPWNMTGRLHKVYGSDDPMLSRTINAWSMTIWEDLDYLAQYFGIDYTVVNRDIYWWDTHLSWSKIADLDTSWLSKHPRVVEYGNRFASRYVKTDGSGYAGVATAETSILADYGWIDVVANEIAQADRPDSTIPGVPSIPTDTELAAWQATAQDRVYDMSPPKVSVVIPSDTSLLPNATPFGWDPDTLMPGSWFVADVSYACASVREYHKLTELKVREVGDHGEEVSIATVSAPSKEVTQ